MDRWPMPPWVGQNCWPEVGQINWPLTQGGQNENIAAACCRLDRLVVHTDLKSDSIMLCVIAPLLLSLVLVLSVAEFIKALDISFDADSGEGGD